MKIGKRGTSWAGDGRGNGRTAWQRIWDRGELEYRQSRDLVRYSMRRRSQIHGHVIKGRQKGIGKPTEKERGGITDKVEVAPRLKVGNWKMIKIALFGLPQGFPKRRRLRR